MARRMMTECVVVTLLMAEASGLLWAGSPPTATQNWALEFDGVDDYVNLGNGSSLHLSGDLTVCAWCRMGEGTSGRYLGILGKMNATSPYYKGYCLARDSKNKFHFWIGEGYILRGWESENTCADSEWHHVAGVMDAGMMVIYVDGVGRPQQPMGIQVADSGLAACIGKECIKDDADFFKGLIDEVRFYDRKLTSTEIASVMAGGLRSDPSLVGLWDMEESGGQTIQDRSGRGNNGTLGRSSSADASDPRRVPSNAISDGGCSDAWHEVLTFDTDAEYQQYVTTNNAEHRYCGGNPVDRVVNQSPDPKGMLRMRPQKDCNSRSGQYLYMIPAWASILLSVPAPCNPQDGLSWVSTITFSYKFRSATGCLKVFYNGQRLPAVSTPDSTADGGASSSRWGTYTATFVAPTGTSSVELQLSGPNGTEVVLDNVDLKGKRDKRVVVVTLSLEPVVRCLSHCRDIAGWYEGIVGPEDFLAATRSVGTRVGSLYWCLDQTFTPDGFASLEDALYWGWVESLPSLNQCGVQITAQGMDEAVPASVPAIGNCQISAPLLVAGKRYAYDPYSDARYFFEDGLFGLDANYTVTAGPCAWANDRLCGRLAQSTLGKVYQLHVTEGVVSIADGQSVLRPTTLGSVDIGWRPPNNTSPIQDMAFDNDGNVYIVPVVQAGSYKAAQVKLGKTPPSSAQLGKVYDYPGHPLWKKGAYEIEVYNQGRMLYVLDKRQWTDSVLLRFDLLTGSKIDYLDVSSVRSLQAPTAFHVSAIDGTVFIAMSSPYGSALVRLNSSLADPKVVDVQKMDYITSITQEPGTRATWVAGFEILGQAPLTDVLDGDIVFSDPDYRPMLARIPWDSVGPIEAVCVSDYTSGGNDYLSLPLSMVWTGK